MEKEVEIIWNGKKEIVKIAKWDSGGREDVLSVVFGKPKVIDGKQETTVNWILFPRNAMRACIKSCPFALNDQNLRKLSTEDSDKIVGVIWDLVKTDLDMLKKFKGQSDSEDLPKTQK